MAFAGMGTASWSGTWIVLVANLVMSVGTKSSHVGLPQHLLFAMSWFMSKIILKICGDTRTTNSISVAVVTC